MKNLILIAMVTFLGAFSAKADFVCDEHASDMQATKIIQLGSNFYEIYCIFGEWRSAGFNSLALPYHERPRGRTLAIYEKEDLYCNFGEVKEFKLGDSVYALFCNHGEWISTRMLTNDDH